MSAGALPPPNAARFTAEEVVRATGAVASGIARSAFRGVATDSRALGAGALFVALRGANHDGHAYVDRALRAGAAGAVVERGRREESWNGAIFEVPSTLGALGALARLHRDRFSVPLVAVTGSSGKTTTKELTAAVLGALGSVLRTEGNFNNEVGLPLTLLNLGPQHAAAVVEMGMSSPGEISRLCAVAAPHVGIITQIGSAHLGGFGTLAQVAHAKGELFRALSSRDLAVVNADDPHVVGEAQHTVAQRLTYGRSAQVDVRLVADVPLGPLGSEVTVRFRDRDHTFTLPLIGAHNALNATGAFAMGIAVGVAPANCAERLEQVQTPAHRLQLVRGCDGVSILDDCYNANPDSMLAALDTLAALVPRERAVAVLGDMLELGDASAELHLELGRQAAHHAGRAAFFGPQSRHAYNAARLVLGGAATHTVDCDELITELRTRLRAGDTALVKGSRGMRLERVVQALAAGAEG